MIIYFALCLLFVDISISHDSDIEIDHRQLKWVNWLHKQVNDDNGGFNEISLLKDNQKSQQNHQIVVDEKSPIEQHRDEIENNMVKSYVDNESKLPFIRWNQEAINWLPKETRIAKDLIAFGILTTIETKHRIKLIQHWWIDGMKGCLLFIDTEVNKALIASIKLLPGMNICVYSNELSTQDWFKKNPQRSKVASSPLVLFKQFPHSAWYVIGDDDTLFSPLALAQYLTNFDEADKWYLGGRSENMHVRKSFGWDRPGNAFVLSKGLLNSFIGSLLAACLDQASLSLDHMKIEIISQQEQKTSPQNSDFNIIYRFGSFLLHRCLGRIGVPMTSSGGFHSMDDRDIQILRDQIERHPVTPFLSLSHLSRFLFSHRGGGGDMNINNIMSSKLPLWFNVLRGGINPFSRAMWHDPISFSQLTLAGIKCEHVSYTASISTGISVRLWVGELQQLLWHAQTKVEGIIYSNVIKDSGIQGPVEILGDYEFCPIGQSPSSSKSSSSSSLSMGISVYVPRGSVSDGPNNSKKRRHQRRRRRFLFENDNVSDISNLHESLNITVRRLVGPKPLPKNNNGHKPSPNTHSNNNINNKIINNSKEKNAASGSGSDRKIVSQKGLPYSLVIVLEARRPARWMGAPRKMCHSSTHEVAYKERRTRIRRKLLTPLEERNDGMDAEDVEKGETDVEGKEADHGSQTHLILMIGLDECNMASTGVEKYRKDYPFPGKDELISVITEAGGYSIGGELLHRELPSNSFPFLKPTSEFENVKKNQQKPQPPPQNKNKNINNHHHQRRRDRQLRQLKEGTDTGNPRCKWIAWKKELLCEDGLPPPPQRKVGGAGGGGNMKQQRVKPKDFLSQQSLVNTKAYLNDENRSIVENVAFGIIGSENLALLRLPFLKLWWLPGSVGCFSIEGHDSNGGNLPFIARALLPIGLDCCPTPEYLQNKLWYFEDKHGTHRGALMPLILLNKFPLKNWYVIGDDDTLFSPLALAQYLTNFNFNEPWFIGGRSEDISQREHLGWDMGFGGGGLVLSKGLILGGGYEAALETCYDHIPWQAAPGGDWVLHRCLSRLGVPLTPAPGMHQFDLAEGTWYYASSMLDLFERHPIAPFISVHHPSRVFGVHIIPPSYSSSSSHEQQQHQQNTVKSFALKQQQLQESSKFSVGQIGQHTEIGTIGEGKEILIAQDTFFEAMHHDPIGFLQYVLCEIPTNHLKVHEIAPAGFALIISSGFSIRLWVNKKISSTSSSTTSTSTSTSTSSDLSQHLHPSINEFIWDQSRVDILSPPLENINLYNKNTVFSRYLFKSHQEIFSTKFTNSLKSQTTLSIYEPEQFSSIHQQQHFNNKMNNNNNNIPYKYIIVCEERQSHRWVGAPLKFCHSGSYELEVILKLAPIAGSIENDLFLLLSTRDCSIPKLVPAALPTRDEIYELISSLKFPQPKNPNTAEVNLVITTRELNVPNLAFLH